MTSLPSSWALHRHAQHQALRPMKRQSIFIRSITSNRTLGLLLAGLLTVSAHARESFVKRDTFDVPVPGLTDDIRMIGMPGGEFTVSADGRPLCGKNAQPTHSVTLKPFALASTEVSYTMWDLCVAKGGCAHSPESPGWGRGLHPAGDISWDDAQQFIAWLNRTTGRTFRLPTADEWEYAARAGVDLNAVPAAATDPNKVNFEVSSLNKPGERKHQSREGTVPVGSLPPNPWGLHEMAGNLSEWTSDCGCDHDYAHQRPPARKGCDERLLRGGSYTSVAERAIPTARSQLGPWFRAAYTGFRLAMDGPPASR